MKYFFSWGLSLWTTYYWSYFIDNFTFLHLTCKRKNVTSDMNTPPPPKMNKHWRPTIKHDSRAISFKLSFGRFKMLLQRTLYFKNRTFFNFLLQLPVISVNMGKIVVWLVLVRRTSTRGVTTMGRVCVAMDGLGRIAPKVGTRIVWRQHF